jgi:hypothetical protein|tara:strand:- start:682 stop:843 length:162 start_codon:yes stop_codon:yes gene_type:complete
MVLRIASIKTRGKVYYQAREGSEVILHLGSADQIVKAVQYFRDQQKKAIDTNL